ncbi:hypothetical protein [Actinoplanes sp. RD1]|uniref:hypothetical protein n=1 Tax=Actinoplanes sp. RD1 TaxID=3064538 RepID=UPI0027427CF6|nr:hypothetical protein [Actinoplanes sp. RD1]
MNTDAGTTSVTVQGGAHQVVAGVIHGGVGNNYYQVPRGASPTDKFRYARRCLASGQATTARAVMAEVVLYLRYSTRVRFYWLLAFFSQRTLSELTPEEREVHAAALEQIGALPRNRWSVGIEVIGRLIVLSDQRTVSAASIEEVLQDIEALDPLIRAEVLRHLERVLHGSVKDAVWQGEVDQARDHRLDGRRGERVWKFFEPDPAPPRTRPVRPAEVSAAGSALALTALALVAAGVLGRLALQRDDSSALVALVAACFAAGMAVVNGAEWRRRA